jgi:hypothetical protein
LNEKLEFLAVSILAVPIVFTGILFYPVIILITPYQYRSSQVKKFSFTQFKQTAPFRWQTFAYPLPALKNFLVKLGLADCQMALTAIQYTQLRSLQDYAAKNAALTLATKPKTAINFCGLIATQYNPYTLKHLAKTGAIAQALAGLTKQQEKEEEQPLRLILGKMSVVSNLPFLKNKGLPEWVESFNNIREANLSARLDYAQQQLKTCETYQNIKPLQQVIGHLQTLTASDFTQLTKLNPIIVERLNDQQQWLTGGVKIIDDIHNTLDFMTEYREYSSTDSRCSLLNAKIKTLEILTWNDLPNYWKTIGQELSLHWINLLKKESRQAREFLQIKIDNPKTDYCIGEQQLQLQLNNISSVIARKVTVFIKETEQIGWHHTKTKLKFIEPKQKRLINFDFECSNSGNYVISGQLNAYDVNGNPYQQPFSFKIYIGIHGKPYQLPTFNPYVVGECLGDDRTFAGRKELFHSLRSYWLQPKGKAAIALIGQRRIGKTSLLQKIERDGVEKTNLIPIFINIQGISGDYDFLNQTATAIAKKLASKSPSLDRQQPYADFKDYLLNLELDNQRFLIMLDEADLIPTRKLSDQLPGFLRALMQEPQYPVLLLFCGTHALQHLSSDYASIFFNTVQFKQVSYLSKAESHQVLTKAAKEILDYDPATLDTAYRLTQGQPLLLQSLGANIIDYFNAVILDEKKRSNYVNLNDLEYATDGLIKQGSAAFQQHWQDCNTAEHYLLSGLAWATDELNRPQLDLDGIKAVLKEVRLEISPQQVFKIVERFTIEEILIRDGLTYRYAVPLYRRWVAWHQRVEIVSNEGI